YFPPGRARGGQEAFCFARKGRYLAGEERWTDQVALGEIAAEPAQQVPGGGVLHPFGHHLQSEAVAELDGRGDDRDRAGLCLRDERAVDLQFIERQYRQLRERGMPG